MRRSTAILSVLVIAVIVGPGCKHAPMPTLKELPAASLEAGWTPYDDASNGFGLGIPSGWSDKNPNSIRPEGDVPATGNSSTDEVLNKMSADMNKQSDAEEARDKAKRAEKGIFLTIYMQVRSIPGETMTRFFVKKIADANQGLEDAAADAKTDFKGADPAKKVTVPIGDAMRMDSKLTNRDGGVVTSIMYVLVNGPDVYHVTFITEGDPQVVQDVAPKVMETFRVHSKPAK